MTVEARREWTPSDIVEETCRQHTGPGFFNVLSDVCEAAFGGYLTDPDTGDWEWGANDQPENLPSNWHEFGVDDITIGKLIDFFDKRGRHVPLKWHNQAGGPAAYVVIDDGDIAADFCSRFGINWLDNRERQARRTEDTVRAGR